MKLKVGIIGLGYWGPNYVRNFANSSHAEVVWICDISRPSLKTISHNYPKSEATENYLDLLDDPDLDCVAIATPPATHYKIASEFLKAGKHVFIAKPLATNYDDAKKLAHIASEKHVLLFTDLTYLYANAIVYLKKFVKKELGIPYYYDSSRSNLGLIQKDVNVIWDLAPHDLGILDDLFGVFPQKVYATASSHHKIKNVEEMAHVTLFYPNDFVAHIHVSWLSPLKLRTILIGGSKTMAYFNDVEQDEKVKIYDKGVEISSTEITPFKPIYRSGKITIPNIPAGEALSMEIDDFIRKVTKRDLDKNNIERNLRIVKILEACDVSIKLGKPIILRG